MGQGAVTPGYSANRGEVVRILNGALATELVCMMRYRRHHFMARGLAARSAAEEFLTHAGQELVHVDQLAARIVQLNGEPNFNPSGLAERSSAE
jgi:bacterioferritin